MTSITDPLISALTDDQRLARVRAVRIGAYLFPAFLPLDVFTAFVVYPNASLARVAAIRVATTGLLFAFSFAIARVSRPRLVHLCGLSMTSVSIALMASELGGPGSPYMHGLTLVILISAAIIAMSLREALVLGTVIVISYPLAFVGLAALGVRYDTAWGSLAVQYLLVVSAFICASAASHANWVARLQLHQARRLGRYRLEARLGHGAQGEVWLAHDEPLDRDVALKILRARDASQQAIESFEREALINSKLKSPHTVRVYEFGASDDGVYFMAMEHLVGHDFAEMVTLFGPTTPSHAVHLVKQICHSLEEAHAAGLIHRDIKPSNLFAAEVGEQRDVVKVLDFGIARSIIEGDLKKTAIRGTPTYLAPETAKGQPPGVAADLYSLGATLYFLLTGTPPFSGDVFEILRAHKEVPPEPPSVRLGRPLPPDLESIVMRCLEKEPSARFATARELRLALESCTGIVPWTTTDASRFWEIERQELVRRWTDETIA